MSAAAFRVTVLLQNKRKPARPLQEGARKLRADPRSRVSSRTSATPVSDAELADLSDRVARPEARLPPLSARPPARSGASS